jgi:ribonuclease HI
MSTDRMAISADGASRGNPGAAAIGAIIKDEQGGLIARLSRRIGKATNNQAEYQAVIEALREAIRLGARKVDITLDSELVVRQLSGRYRVKSATLKPLYQEAQELLARLEMVAIRHVPRTQNSEADRLANMALR